MPPGWIESRRRTQDHSCGILRRLPAESISPPLARMKSQASGVSKTNGTTSSAEKLAPIAMVLLDCPMKYQFAVDFVEHRTLRSKASRSGDSAPVLPLGALSQLHLPLARSEVARRRIVIVVSGVLSMISIGKPLRLTVWSETRAPIPPPIWARIRITTWKWLTAQHPPCFH